MVLEKLPISERRTCKLIEFDRSTHRYRSKGRNDMVLRERIKALACDHRRHGSPRLCVLLKREGFTDNHKRVERIYREERLQVIRRKRKRTCRSKRVRTIEIAKCPNEKWSMDFVQDCMVGGRRFRALTIVDNFTREAVHIEVGVSLSGQRVTRVLDYLAWARELPQEIVVDNGPEFTSLAMDQWAHQNKVSLDFIQPGKPTQNAFIESFNGKFRDECLNEHWFINLSDAKEKIEKWRCEYNTFRPHSSLGGMPPSLFAAGHLKEERLTWSVAE